MNRPFVYIILLFSVNLLYGQHPPPQGISHQAVIRDSNNQLVVNSPVGVRVSILAESPDGGAVYVETHSPESNPGGLITYVIGQGTVVSGTFAGINWSAGAYYLKTEADPAGGDDEEGSNR